MQTYKQKNGWFTRGLLPAIAMAGLLALTGCATQQPYNSGNTAYGTTYGDGYNNDSRACNQCGVVQSVRQVYVQDSGGSSHALGTIIGAVAGGLLGNTVGKGDGRKAATVAGAVAGGAVGNSVAKHNGDGNTTAWQVVVQLDNGRYATVTQRSNPNVQRGDRVQVRNDRVYLL